MTGEHRQAPGEAPWMGTVAPVERSIASARATYDRLAAVYDLTEAPFERHARATGLRLLAARPGERILEIGYGTGHTLAALARQVGPAGQVIGIDLSAGMARVARRRVARAGHADRVLLLQGDAHRLPLRAGVVDAVTMSFVLELIATPDIPVVLDECRRVLRLGGRLAVVALQAEQPAPLMARLYLWGHRRLPRLLDCRPLPLSALLTAQGWQVEAFRRISIVGLPVAAAVAT